MNGTVTDRLKSIQIELMSIAHQAGREGWVEWPLIPVMTATEQALDQYLILEKLNNDKHLLRTP